MADPYPLMLTGDDLARDTEMEIEVVLAKLRGTSKHGLVDQVSRSQVFSHCGPCYHRRVEGPIGDGEWRTMTTKKALIVYPALITLLVIVHRANVHERDAHWRSLDDAAQKALAEGRLTEAERVLRRSVEAARSFGDHDPRLARSLTGLGQVLIAEAKSSEAVPLFHEALGIFEKNQGDEGADVALCLTGLATAHGRQAEDAAAEPLLRRALAIQEKRVRPGSPRGRSGPRRPGLDRVQ